MRQLWYTGYIVSSLTFLVLSYVEWQIPGFVSLVFPIYFVLIVAVVCGMASLAAAEPYKITGRVHELVAVAIGIVLAMTIFHATAVFGAYRLVLALVVLVLPILLLKALSDVKE